MKAGILSALVLLHLVGCGSTIDESRRWMRRGVYTMIAGAVVAGAGTVVTLTADDGQSGFAQAMVGAVTIGVGLFMIVPVGTAMTLGGHVGLTHQTADN
jgi:formate/nitrite transporter FocA (FNT family)